MGNSIGIKCIIFLCAIALAITLVFTLNLTVALAEEDVFVTLVVDGGEMQGLVVDENGNIQLELTQENQVLDAPTKEGYDFLGWTATNQDDDQNYITELSKETQDITTLYARYTLAKPTIIEAPKTEIGELYDDETTHTLSVTATHPLDGTITYQWYKNDELLEGETQNFVIIKNCNQSGYYYCVITFEFENQITTVTTETSTVYIEKVPIMSMPQVILKGVYDKNKTLGDYELPEGYSWINETIVPDCNTVVYPSIYKDDNHLDFYSNITLVISKAEQVITWHDISVVYDGEEHSITVSTSGDGEITFSDENTIRDVGKKEITIFVAETDNYLAAQTRAFLEVLPQEIAIVWENTQFVYDGNEHIPSAQAVDNAQNVLNLIIENAQIDAGCYNATATSENNNYVLINPTIEYTISKQEIQITWAELEFVYDATIHCPTANAIDAQERDVELTVANAQVDAGTYTATATTTSNNYTLLNADQEYTILKATYDIEKIILEDKEFVFDNQPHCLEVQNLPTDVTVEYDLNPIEVGKYTVTATFTTNNPNYNDIPSMTATLTVLQNRFESDWYEIICPEGIDPDLTLSIELIQNLEGLYNKNSGKLDYIFGFKVVCSNGTIYEKPLIIKFNYEKVDINHLVLSVDEQAQEQIITYAYEQGKIIIEINDTTKNYVLAKRTESLLWIIPLILGICLVTCAIAFVVNKKSKKTNQHN